ncbi:hypothetical protein HN587_01135 [Candidatus Woesearchaeota archaeon]|jgi:hypothetical protein|nr:hypothetical protein [Candidatus Woesearchaeota archaeon]
MNDGISRRDLLKVAGAVLGGLALGQTGCLEKVLGDLGELEQSNDLTLAVNPRMKFKLEYELVDVTRPEVEFSRTYAKPTKLVGTIDQSDSAIVSMTTPALLYFLTGDVPLEKFGVKGRWLDEGILNAQTKRAQAQAKSLSGKTSLGVPVQNRIITASVGIPGFLGDSRWSELNDCYLIMFKSKPLNSVEELDDTSSAQDCCQVGFFLYKDDFSLNSAMVYKHVEDADIFSPNREIQRRFKRCRAFEGMYRVDKELEQFKVPVKYS